MSNKITVLRSTKTKRDGKKGPYPVVELAYKNHEGKTKGMTIFGFGDQAEIAAVAEELKEGDVCDVEFEKNDKGFWQFRNLTKVEVKEGQVVEKPVSRGNWETSEERAARQVMIVRQSSLSTAVALFDVNKTKASPQDVVNVARLFEEYVFSKPTKDVE